MTKELFDSLTYKVPFIQEVSGVYASTFLDTDKLKMALWARKVAGYFKKRPRALCCVLRQDTQLSVPLSPSRLTNLILGVT